MADNMLTFLIYINTFSERVNFWWFYGCFWQIQRIL